MGCNCGKGKLPKTTQTVTDGANQALLKKVSDQQIQQQTIQRIIQQSSNPAKTLIKIYR